MKFYPLNIAPRLHFKRGLVFFDLRQAKKGCTIDVNIFTQLEINRLGTQLVSAIWGFKGRSKYKTIKELQTLIFLFTSNVY
jgi:hypothetical protein